jgi:hypothetical protein
VLQSFVYGVCEDAPPTEPRLYVRYVETRGLEQRCYRFRALSRADVAGIDLPSLRIGRCLDLAGECTPAVTRNVCEQGPTRAQCASQSRAAPPVIFDVFEDVEDGDQIKRVIGKIVKRTA